MKLHLIVPAVLVVGLVACSKETSSPDAAAATAATTPATAAAAQENAAPETEGLTQLPDQLSAEEIQARREEWVSGGGPNAGTADSRMAGAPVASRE
jgi:hypothetical protein